MSTHTHTKKENAWNCLVACFCNKSQVNQLHFFPTHSIFLSSASMSTAQGWHLLERPKREGNGNPLQYSCLEKSHGWKSLVGCSPWGRLESDTTEWLHFHFSLSQIGEGNGNPLQCSCLENPRDRGAWWAAVYGVTKSQTRLKWLSSSSSSRTTQDFRV